MESNKYLRRSVSSTFVLSRIEYIIELLPRKGSRRETCCLRNLVQGFFWAGKFGVKSTVFGNFY